MKRIRKQIAYKGGILVLEAIEIVLVLGIADKVGIGSDSGSSLTPNQANKRRLQR
jgi:hypothetical protein